MAVEHTYDVLVSHQQQKGSLLLKNGLAKGDACLGGVL